ncbi:MAG: glycoside hydrolase domain-containing protein [Armatimonadota bacterium]
MRLLCVTLMAALSASCCAAPAAPAPVNADPEILCPPAVRPPVMDGALDDACWTASPAIATLRRPDGVSRPRVKTEVRVVRDSEALYIAFRCAEPFMEALKLSEPEKPWRDDSVEVLIDPFRGRRHFLQFIVSASGARLALVQTPPGDLPLWPVPSAWQAAVRRSEGEWTVEMAIPWRELGLNAEPRQPPRINFARNRQARPERSSWVPRAVPGTLPGQPFGNLLTGPKPSTVVWMSAVARPEAGIADVRLRLETDGPSPVALRPRLSAHPSVFDRTVRLREVSLSAASSVSLSARLPIPHGLSRIGVDVFGEIPGGGAVFLGSFTLPVPPARPALAGRLLTQAPWGQVWEASATEKVFPDSRPSSRRSGPVTLAAAKNEFEPFQIVLTPDRELKDVSVSVSELRGPGKIPPDAVSVRLVATVPVTLPSSVDVLPGDYPDPLIPLNDPVTLPAGRSTAFWFTVRVPSGAPAGEYSGEVTITPAGLAPVKVPVSLRVWDFELPRLPYLRTAYGTWHGLKALCRWHGIDMEDVGPVRQMEELLNRTFHEHRIAPFNAFQTHDVQVSVTEGRVRLDFSRFDEGAEKYLPLFNAFMLPGSFRRGVGGKGPGDEGYEDLKVQFLKQLSAHLREKGWLAKGYNYIYDEPDPPQYPLVAEEARLWRQADPDLKILLTEQVEDELIGSVDIWTPVLDAYSAKRCRERQEAGDAVWWYVCTGPKHPYPNYFIDYPAAGHRIFHWMTYAWGVTGVLYWETMFWSGNPWEEPMTYSDDGRRKPFGNGDGFLLYPATGKPAGKPLIAGPIESIRWEMLREGIEDYDLFRMLESAVEDAGRIPDGRRLAAEGRKALDAVRAACPSLTDYELDPGRLYEIRRRAGEALEKLVRAGARIRPPAIDTEKVEAR